MSKPMVAPSVNLHTATCVLNGVKPSAGHQRHGFAEDEGTCHPTAGEMLVSDWFEPLGLARFDGHLRSGVLPLEDIPGA